ncbi:chorismate--pyruvate lyase family protein [Piscirickettsia litoralis]|uniref:Chorismate lyase n=1 Tax=Piscirickettsia litoralis TaxID=1891921 RepID=A0ABX3A8X0_9GAMM|nr:chorismate lyase [Piscirickettsia litoralis]ODN44093.1 chorismate lyase [Piscirickettsia litoralis]
MSLQPIVWQRDATVIGASDHRQQWLEKPYCLTSAIKRATHEFSVRVLAESSKPLQTVYQSDDIVYQQDHAWEREVYLCGDNTPWVYASVVFSLAKPPEVLETLGNRPLGETLFFHPDGRDVARSVMEYACIDQAQDVYLPAFNVSNQDKLYARRSVFSPSWGQVLVVEVFLDALPDYPEEN